ncbi:phosphodiester glycosidase family protein [Patescibacteria group bacterium]|nr:phosphodiester glycosidase family protein [Patescibacteria group bacterium]
MKKIIKKLFLITFVLVSVFSVSFFIKGNYKRQNPKLSPNVLGLPDSYDNLEVDIKFNDNLYRVNWYEIGNIDNLFLLVNSDKLTSQEFKEKEKCVFLSSGGYYKTDYSPTGLLISEYKEISPFVNSSLANGIFSVNDFATPRITPQVPRDRLRMALQAGPLLKENNGFKNLSLKNDEEARRVVLGVTGENKAIFMIFYNPESVFIGPYLKDLPEIIKEFENETGIVFADAMNLDGGTPTTFNKKNTNLTESTIVGNFFCLK